MPKKSPVWNKVLSVELRKRAKFTAKIILPDLLADMHRTLERHINQAKRRPSA